MKNNIISKIKGSFSGSAQRNIILSVVALLLISVMLLTAVYAWVESVSSIVIENNTTMDGVTENHVIEIEDRLLTKGTLNTSSSSAIILSKYFRTAGNFHFAAASSADGVNIFFPVIGSEEYRRANINDKNVNYLDFTVTVKLTNGATEPKGFVFENDLIMAIGETTGINNNIRCAITFDDETPKIYSNTASVAQAVCDIDGSTTAESTRSFASSTGTGTNSESIFTIRDNDEHKVNIKIWYQDNDNASADLGKRFKISNFIIKPKIPSYNISARACYLTSGTEYALGSTGGRIKLGGSTSHFVSTAVQNGGNTVLTAKPATGYAFVGWYTDVNGGAPAGANYTQEVNWATPIVTEDITYYARFIKTNSVTVNIMSSSDGVNYSDDTSGSSTTVTGTSGSVTLTYNPVNYGYATTMTATPSDGYVFDGWYDTSDTQLSTDAEYTTANITDAATYVAKFKVVQNITVYYYNTNNWSNVYAYCWEDARGSGNQNAAFPGEAMTHIGNNVWAYEVDMSKNYDKIIFAYNSSNQTDDLDLPSADDSNVYYCYNQSGTGSWTTAPQKRTVTVSNLSNATLKVTYVGDDRTQKTINENGSAQIYDGVKITLTNTPASGYSFTNVKTTVGGTTNTYTTNDYGYVLTKNNTTVSGTVAQATVYKRIYFEDNAGWGAPKIHIWKSGGSDYTSWSNDPVMNKCDSQWNGHNVYYYDVNITDYDMLKFHKNGDDSKQTGNFSYDSYFKNNNAYYYNGSSGSWYKNSW